MVERYARVTLSFAVVTTRLYPSTMLRMVPLPVPGRNYDRQDPRHPLP